MYIAGILFVLAIIFITINFFIIEDFLAETQKLLYELPEKIESENEIQFGQQILDEIQKKWDKMETYISVSLEHNMRKEFMQEFTRTKGYFESGMYDDYSSSIELLSKMIEYIKFNEGASFGNIM